MPQITNLYSAQSNGIVHITKNGTICNNYYPFSKTIIKI